jgi:thiamine-monophosphate kinase
LSDIAAMAGTPTAALITLGLPSDYDLAWLEQVYAGLSGLAARHHVAIVGGETTALPQGTLLSISLLGTVPREHCVRRSGARVGDAVFVTGSLGGSLQGRHLTFEPRLAEARWLAANFDIHARIDLSDGMASDLRHITQASGVGAWLRGESIPISLEARGQARAQNKPPLLAALTDGEDFELLFTVAGADAVRLLDQWKENYPALPLTCVGKIRAEPGITLQDQHGSRSLNVHGYDHFTKPS